MAITSVPEPGPRTVSGYDEAHVAGITPNVPATKPQLLPGKTADRLAKELIVKAIVGSVVFAQLVDAIPKALVLILGLGWWAFVFIVLAGSITKRSAEEFHHGYSTLQLQFGLPGYHANRRWKGSGHRTPWDYSGLWLLDGRGIQVKAEPNRSVDPPGFYPSPNRLGELELWTGVAWSGRYRQRS